MNRLEQLVSVVRGRMLLRRFLDRAASGLVLLAAAGVLAVTVDRLFAVSLPGAWRWVVLLIGLTACIAGAAIVAIIGHPTAHAAAVAIDHRLGLKERFATAIHATRSGDDSKDDAFIQAAILDAEATARNVDLARRFPIDLPRRRIAAASALALLALAGAMFIPQMNLFERRPDTALAAADLQSARTAARANVERALAVVAGAAQWRGNEDELGRLVDELRNLAKSPELDPDLANRKARRAMELVDGAAAVRRPRAAAAGAAGDKAGAKAAAGAGADDRAGNRATTGDRDNASERPETANGGSAGGGTTTGRDRPDLAGERIAANAKQPQVGPAGRDDDRPGVNPAGNGGDAGNNNPAAGAKDPGQAPGIGKNANGKDGNANANANANNGPAAIAAGGARSKAAAPYAVTREHSPSQESDRPDSRTLARDLIGARAPTGRQETSLANVARAAREQAADEIDAERVSGPAQGAARRYFRTLGEEPAR